MKAQNKTKINISAPLGFTNTKYAVSL